jgi:hypothetical protein
MYFQDVWNPTDEEIKLWAYAEDKMHEQDFELAVGTIERFPMICDFIRDPRYNKSLFFLSTLYVVVGDTIRSGSRNDKAILVLRNMLVQLDDVKKHEELSKWLSRSLRLIENPESYTYPYWGLGSLYVYGENK